MTSLCIESTSSWQVNALYRSLPCICTSYSQQSDSLQDPCILRASAPFLYSAYCTDYSKLHDVSHINPYCNYSKVPICYTGRMEKEKTTYWPGIPTSRGPLPAQLKGQHQESGRAYWAGYSLILPAVAPIMPADWQCLCRLLLHLPNQIFSCQ